MGKLLFLFISGGTGAVSGYLRFGASTHAYGMWIDVVFLASIALTAVLILSLLTDRMRRTVHASNRPEHEPKGDGTSGPASR